MKLGATRSFFLFTPVRKGCIDEGRLWYRSCAQHENTQIKAKEESYWDLLTIKQSASPPMSRSKPAN